MAISGRAFLTAAAILASSWEMMRAISMADLVSSPAEASFGSSVVRLWRSLSGWGIDFSVEVGDGMVSVAIRFRYFPF
jgi:hypothetical protein